MYLPTEDQRKLHAEINQLANQRFLLITASIAFFGIMLSFVMQGVPQDHGKTLSGLIFLKAGISSGTLFLLYWVSFQLRKMARTYAIYLVETKSSVWERDIMRLRDEWRGSPILFSSRTQAIIYLLLILASGVSPYAIKLSNDFSVPQSEYIWWYLQGGVCLLLMGFVLLGFPYNPTKRYEDKIRPVIKTIIDEQRDEH